MQTIGRVSSNVTNAVFFRLKGGGRNMKMLQELDQSKNVIIAISAI